jgi:hypothetical protein
MSTCFVVQGFGKKTDYTDGRVLDLNASYEIIKEAAEAAGLRCVRADEIPHSGAIDTPMYEMLLSADLVIADLSTYNLNAAFELGVRYALRPSATIIVAEENFKYPFDVSHIVIRRYKHLGEEIGYKEAKRFRDDLTRTIQAIRAEHQIDSPVYTFLPGLKPPQRFATRSARMSASQRTTAPPSDLPTAKALLDAALAKITPPDGKLSDYAGAKTLLESVREQRPNDPFVVQQQALATYKSEQPSPEAALEEARRLILELGPANSNDPETLALWGAIHERRWELIGDPDDLSAAIDPYERRYYLKQNGSDAIGLAFLLDQRAVESLKIRDKDNAIADAMQAKRIRREVVRRTTQSAAQEPADPIKQFGIISGLWQASLGLGDDTAAAHWATQADALAVPRWMRESQQNQVDRLRRLQEDYAKLIASMV